MSVYLDYIVREWSLVANPFEVEIVERFAILDVLVIIGCNGVAADYPSDSQNKTFESPKIFISMC